MAKSQKVAYATQDVTLHKALGEYTTPFGRVRSRVESVVLSAGQSVPFDELAKYQQEAIENGQIAGVEILGSDEAEKKLKAWEDAQPVPHVAVYDARKLVGPDANDGSHSDSEVPFEEREANHIARAEGEAALEAEEDKETKSGRKSTKKVAGEQEAQEGELLDDSNVGVGSIPKTDE